MQCYFSLHFLVARCTILTLGITYSRVPNNRPLPIINYSKFFQPPSLFQPMLLLNLESLKSALRESVHCSAQKDRDCVQKYMELALPTSCSKFPENLLLFRKVANLYFKLVDRATRNSLKNKLHMTMCVYLKNLLQQSVFSFSIRSTFPPPPPLFFQPPFISPPKVFHPPIIQYPRVLSTMHYVLHSAHCTT